MAVTYDKIATTTLSSSETSIDFTSISSSYTDLIVIGSIKLATNNGNQMYFRINGDTGSNYSVTTFSGSGSSTASTQFTNQPYIRYNYVNDPNSTSFTNLIMHVNNYSNSTTYKTTLSQLTRAATGAPGIDVSLGSWRSTSAINRLTFIIESSNSFASGSIFTLYGILKA